MNSFFENQFKIGDCYYYPNKITRNIRNINYHDLFENTLIPYESYLRDGSHTSDESKMHIDFYAMISFDFNFSKIIDLKDSLAVMEDGSVVPLYLLFESKKPFIELSNGFYFVQSKLSAIGLKTNNPYLILSGNQVFFKVGLKKIDIKGDKNNQPNYAFRDSFGENSIVMVANKDIAADTFRGKSLIHLNEKGILIEKRKDE